MKRRSSGSDLNQLLDDQTMSVYEYDGGGGSVADQVVTVAAATSQGGIVVGVDNFCCRLCVAVTADVSPDCGNSTATTCHLEAAATVAAVLDSNRYDTCCKDKQQQTTGAATSQVPVVNIDSENYMLRGVGMDSPRSRSYSFNQQQQTQVVFKENSNKQQQQIVDMDMFYVRETGSSLAGHEPENNVERMSIASMMPDNSVVIGNCVSIPAGVTTSCARTMSFHALFCSCRLSCCCMCGSVCSPDCHSCFHSLCVRFAANYVCQRNSDVLQPATLNHDKVRQQTL